MTTSHDLPSKGGSIGDTIRLWRKNRKISQMDLALNIDTSARHLSFVETGKSRPSRQLIIRIAESLNMPFRHRNALLTMAGHTLEREPLPFDAESMTTIRQALQRLLDTHEPLPAFVVDSAYNIKMKNSGYARLVASLTGADALKKYTNVYLLTFSEDGLCNRIIDWPRVGRFMLDRLKSEASFHQDARLFSLYNTCNGLFRNTPEVNEPSLNDLPVLPLMFEHKPTPLSFITMITTLGTPLDAATQELRIESLHPSDEATKLLFTKAAALV
ncbi:hypothetical protein NNJEOMEG_00353 [Fundidesulfovibrio magnetotacticus]|uniref:HTH cro/C1-type domain-containing protein n=1 Tax=Fundidesulfovibrio magnetotacticus TaxID=2730080 RepID=A0A6V8LQB7_9BACT|nr:helix-turn-helix transcriptional regulator [Fundidesulfovibrio magnetotacticus]GFK92528.1 hypothetical protein NNJEOMEG_00353 [Fundidesulfovibrio magnetotacticus]